MSQSRILFLILFFISSGVRANSRHGVICAESLQPAKVKLSDPAQAYVRLVTVGLSTHILDFFEEGSFSRLLDSSVPFNPFSLSSTEPTEIALAQAIEAKLVSLQSEWNQIRRTLRETAQRVQDQKQETVDVIDQASWVLAFVEASILSVDSEITETTSWQVINGRVFSAAVSKSNLLHIFELDPTTGKVSEVIRKPLRDQARSLSWHVVSNVAYIAITESDAHIHIYEFRMYGESLELKYPSRKRVGLIDSRVSWKAIGNRNFIAFGAGTHVFVLELNRSHELEILGKLDVDGTAISSPSWYVEDEKVLIACVVYKCEQGARFYILDLNLSASNGHRLTIIDDNLKIKDLTRTSTRWQKLGDRLFLAAGWIDLNVLEYVASENKLINYQTDTNMGVTFLPQWQIAKGRAFIAAQSFSEGIYIYLMDPEKGLTKMDQVQMRTGSSAPTLSWAEIEGRFYLAAIGNDMILYIYELDAENGKLREISAYRAQASIQTEPRWYTAKDGTVFVSVADTRGTVYSFYFKSRLMRTGEGE